MSKKDKQKKGNSEDVEALDDVVLEEPVIEEEQPVKEKPLYEPVMWKGVKEVFKCSNCGHCEDRKDDIIVHVIKHVPDGKKAAVLDSLVKEI